MTLASRFCQSLIFNIEQTNLFGPEVEVIRYYYSFVKASERNADKTRLLLLHVHERPHYVFDCMIFLNMFTTVKHFVTTVCEKRYTNKVYL